MFGRTSENFKLNPRVAGVSSRSTSNCKKSTEHWPDSTPTGAQAKYKHWASHLMRLDANKDLGSRGGKVSPSCCVKKAFPVEWCHRLRQQKKVVVLVTPRLKASVISMFFSGVMISSKQTRYGKTESVLISTLFFYVLEFPPHLFSPRSQTSVNWEIYFDLICISFQIKTSAYVNAHKRKNFNAASY